MDKQEVIKEKIKILESICKGIISQGYTYNVRKSDYSDDTFYVEFSNGKTMSRYRISEHFDRSNKVSLINRINKGSINPTKEFLTKKFKYFKMRCVYDIIDKGEKLWVKI